MKIQILTPEEVIFDGEVSSISVPGSMGEFQMLENHASIVSTLEPGTIKLENISSTSSHKLKDDGKYKIFTIKSGLLEFNNNKGIILCD
ncbi:F0F1 ATP synthase subunit epsilon [Apibacter sp.]|uniref:FoF1 ATP synthase subunit delta/epsilon n=1 Tax=Apibacter sp. TaxID=2023709 RepID=UPI0025D52350|nr:F0F1 ATP synthase subunit epsilon [Apibacter sp.]MCT6869455.1 F0F1 ATP synthase subunit epsilon [Apibacter sp.]